MPSYEQYHLLAISFQGQNEAILPHPTKDVGPAQLEPHPLAKLAGAAEVHNLDGTALGVAEQDVLRLEVAVDDAELRGGQKEQSCAELLCQLPRQVQ